LREDDKHDWLPEELYSDSAAPAKDDRPTDAEIAAIWEYPVGHQAQEEDLTDRQRRALDRDRQERETISKRVLVRNAKKEQMFIWLKTMDYRQLFFAMNPKESGFCMQLLRKFERYGVANAKWITRPQYDWLKTLTGRYLTNDNRFDGQIYSGFFTRGQRHSGNDNNRYRGVLFTFFKAKDAFRVVANRQICEEKKD
jgi:hypothetical protein